MDYIYPVEEHPEFWSSLDALDSTPETTEVVNELIDQVAHDPFAAYANQDRVRVIKSPTSQKNGRTRPALRLAYSIGSRPGKTPTHPQEEVVVLLQVRPYDQATEAQEGWLRVGRTLQQ